MIINGAWYVDSLPTMAIIERADSTLAMFDITPFRPIADADLKQYKGYHPRKCKGQPLPGYLYKFYGLEKNEESSTETIHIRMTPSEKAVLEAYATNLVPQKTVSEVVREYIRSL